MFCKPTFIAESLEDGCHTILCCVLINVLNKTRLVYKSALFHSVQPMFRNASSNSFVFHVLLFLFNMILRIKLKGALSEPVWLYVLLAAFIRSLFLKSRKQFLWYLKLDNCNLMLLLFPAFAFFCLPFPPFLPSPSSSLWLLLLRSCKMVGISFYVVSSSINVLNKVKHVYKTCTNRFSATRVPICI